MWLEIYHMVKSLSLLVFIMNKLFAILEDDERRAVTMRKEIVAKFPDFELIIFENAPDMISWLEGGLEKVTIISLDHDLGPNCEKDGKVFDPGTGRDVVDFLVTQKASCPVVIHTTNTFGGDGMFFALEDGGWNVKRIVPFDDLAWITDGWSQIVAKLIEDR